MKVKLKTDKFKLIIKIKFEDQKYLQPINLQQLMNEVISNVNSQQERTDTDISSDQE